MILLPVDIVGALIFAQLAKLTHGPRPELFTKMSISLNCNWNECCICTWGCRTITISAECNHMTFLLSLPKFPLCAKTLDSYLVLMDKDLLFSCGLWSFYHPFFVDCSDHFDLLRIPRFSNKMICKHNLYSRTSDLLSQDYAGLMVWEFISSFGLYFCWETSKQSPSGHLCLGTSFPRLMGWALDGGSMINHHGITSCFATNILYTRCEGHGQWKPHFRQENQYRSRPRKSGGPGRGPNVP